MSGVPDREASVPDAAVLLGVECRLTHEASLAGRVHGGTERQAPLDKVRVKVGNHVNDLELSGFAAIGRLVGRNALGPRQEIGRLKVRSLRHRQERRRDNVVGVDRDVVLERQQERREHLHTSLEHRRPLDRATLDRNLSLEEGLELLRQHGIHVLKK
mgnify:CR=1 FL=1